MLRNLDKINLRSDNITPSPTALKESGEPESSVFFFYFDSLINGEYTLEIAENVIVSSDSRSSLKSSPFLVEPVDDKNPPVIDSVTIDNQKRFPDDSTVNIVFSEPCRPLGALSEIITAMSDDSIKNDIEFDWSNSFNLKCHLTDLDWGVKYEIKINKTRFLDLSGNLMTDSSITYEFATYSEDSLGSVAGTIFIDTGDIDSKPYIIITGLKGNEIIKESVLDKDFFYRLPPGKYLLKGFLDRNGNGHHDKGNLRPFDYAETMTIHPDTIRVRSRFESAGIEFYIE
jgi:hypothetical protein